MQITMMRARFNIRFIQWGIFAWTTKLVNDKEIKARYDNVNLGNRVKYYYFLIGVGLKFF
jgi:hypothetical protein